MPIMGGGGGGAAFNGGTITNPIEIDPPSDPGQPILTLNAAPAQSADLFDANGTSGALIVLQDGSVIIDEPSTSNNALSIIQSTGTPGNILRVGQGFGSFLTLLRIQKDGALGIQLHSAPGDANVATGEAVLWFDQTNAAAKLMVKGKTADGTVVSAAIALS